ncbi:MAG: hypothetical protein NVSMB18_11170 [Acetobacteraceae bacterium]
MARLPLTRLVRALPIALALSGVALGSARADDVSACLKRRDELAPKAEQFTGEPMIKRLIQADLRRATKEASEGDLDECMEALDHATKLLAGDV